jgi:glycosyltransferase involved in cell wall biosynthesis
MKRNFAKISTEHGKIKTLFKFASFILTEPGFNLVKRVAKKALRKAGLYKELHYGYNEWITARLNPTELRCEYYETVWQLKTNPTFSIVIPVYNPDPKFLAAAIDSVIDQLYGGWELCLSDDCSPNAEVKKVLDGYAARDSRIKVHYRTKNGHISANTNSALALATGDYILFMDHDDLLTPNCLFEFVKHINAHPEDGIIYSDEDKIDDAGVYSSPHFKPDWAPDNLLSRNYMGHVIVVSRAIMNQVKEIREGFEGSQDHDFLLRATECTKHIGHIPKVLYHWRIHQASVASGGEAKPYAFEAARKALEEAMVRRGLPGTVSHIPDTLGGYRMHYQIVKPGKVSVIIPTKDQVALLKCAIDSILTKTTYKDYEIIVLNNNSNTPEFFALMEEYTKQHPDKFRCIDANFPFNFAKLMNVGVAASTGDYILFANNDIEVISGDWMTEMVSFAQRPHTGAVGVKLLYKDDTIQHAGVVLGLGGAAGHVFVNMHRNDRGYYNYVRSLNNYAAVTAACQMCRKAVYNEVGGMDETLDVEYNDVDLCLKFLSAGYYNVYVPDVEVYHYESATRGHPFQSKESWAQHEKDFGIFNRKWKPLIENDPFYNPNLSITCTDFQLRYDPLPEPQPQTPAPKRSRKTVLIVDHDVPTVDKDAGSRTINNFTDSLLALGCDVRFWVPNMYPEAHYVKLLTDKGVTVLHGEEYVQWNKGWEKYIMAHIDDIDAILLSRSSISLPIMKYLRRHRFPGKIFYYGHDLGYLTARQEAALKGDKNLLEIADRVQEAEDYMYRQADGALMISPEEIAYIKAYINTPIYHVPAYFFDVDAQSPGYSSRSGILYVGGFGHPPNTDAMLWFLEEMYANLEAKGIHLTIAGAKIPDSIFAYQQRFPSLRVMSDVPADVLNDLYAQTRIAVVPLRLGAGIKGKVLEAMAKGVPVVGTDRAFEGLVKEKGFAYTAHNTAGELTEQINALYADEARWNTLSAFGKHYVKANFNQNKMKEVFRQMLQQVS